MSEIQLTRAERREMKRLGKLVDRATESDRRFFERFPHRQHRVRHSHRGEIGQNEIVEGKPLTPPAGFRWFTAVRNVYSGARLRIFTLNAEAAEIDLDEATARRIFELLETPFTRELEARLRKAHRKVQS